MQVDLEIIRGILRQLAIGVPGFPHVIHETFVLSPPHVPGYGEEAVRPQLELLAQKHWIRPSRDIKMKNHPDPVTWRATDQGMDWVRRAWNDAEWQASEAQAHDELAAAAAE